MIGRIYTSHWRNPELKDLAAVIVSISRGRPRWPLPFRYRRYDELAPSDRAWAQQDQRAFRASYEQQLREIGARTILERLAEIGAGRPCVLLCWERDPTDPETPCHRRYLAELLEREAGIAVPELKVDDLPQRADVAQRSFF
jgi:uncharacterized protein DUF488